jgi:hypothetical protein
MKKKMRRYSIYLPKDPNARLDAYLKAHPDETASGYCKGARGILSIQARHPNLEDNTTQF